MRYFLALFFLLLFASAASAQNVTGHVCKTAKQQASVWQQSNDADDCIDERVNGYYNLSMSDADASVTFEDDFEFAFIDITSVTLTATRTVTLVNAGTRNLGIRNGTTGGQDITLSSGGNTLTIPNGVSLIANINSSGWQVVSNEWITNTTAITIGSGDLIPFYDATSDSMEWYDFDDFPSGTGGNSVGSETTLTRWEMLETNVTGSTNSTLEFYFDPTDYMEVRVYFWRLRPQTDNTQILIRLTDDSGTTWHSSGTSGDGDYNWEMWNMEATDGTPGIESSNAWRTNNVDIGQSQRCEIIAREGIDNGTHTDGSMNGLYRLWNARSTTDYAMSMWRINYTYDDAAPNHLITQGHCNFDEDGTNDNAINGIQFWNGILSDAKFVVMGLRDVDSSASVGGVTTDATEETLWENTLAAGETITVRALITGMRDDGDDAYSAEIFNTCRNNGGTTTCGTQQRVEMELGTPTAGVNVDIEADDTADSAEINITGAASENWDWLGNVRWEKQ